MTKSSRGALIVVEGLDRAGKSSQCERLLRSLLDANYKAQYIRFPGTFIHSINEFLSRSNILQTEPLPLES